MNILIIGGTKFVGRHLTLAALNSGHKVTLFNRGQTNPGLFDGVEELVGDRDGGLDILSGRKWDAVIDTCGYAPRIVKQSVDALKESVSTYLFISTISVYDNLGTPGVSENSPLGTIDDPTVEEITGETYGPLKVLCEKAVTDQYGEKALIIRPGVIVGPDDPTDRFSYWVDRISKGGDILCPEPKDYAIQYIDVRDLAEWSIHALETGLTGFYNAAGPEKIIEMDEFLKHCRSTLNKSANLIWAPEKYLIDNDVKPWAELPLWLTGEEQIGFGRIDVSKAIQNGLKFRPLENTTNDTLEWLNSREPDYEWKAGLNRDKELQLLNKLKAD